MFTSSDFYKEFISIKESPEFKNLSNTDKTNIEAWGRHVYKGLAKQEGKLGKVPEIEHFEQKEYEKLQPEPAKTPAFEYKKKASALKALETHYDLPEKELEELRKEVEKSRPEFDKTDYAKSATKSLVRAPSKITSTAVRIGSLAPTVAGAAGEWLADKTVGDGVLKDVASSIRTAGEDTLRLSNLMDAYTRKVVPASGISPETLEEFWQSPLSEKILVAADNVPEQLSTMLIPFASARKGHAAASLAGKQLASAKSLAKQPVLTSLLAKWGPSKTAKIFGWAGSTAQAGSFIGKDQVEQTGKTHIPSLLIAAPLSGLLESVVPSSAARMWGGFKPGSTQAMQHLVRKGGAKAVYDLFKYIGKESGKSALTEAGTEVLQESLQLYSLEWAKGQKGKGFVDAYKEAKKILAKDGFSGLADAIAKNPKINQVVQAGLLGAISGGVFEGAQQTAGATKYSISPLRTRHELTLSDPDIQGKAREKWDNIWTSKEKAEAEKEAATQSILALSDLESSPEETSEAKQIFETLPQKAQVENLHYIHPVHRSRTLKQLGDTGTFVFNLWPADIQAETIAAAPNDLAEKLFRSLKAEQRNKLMAEIANQGYILSDIQKKIFSATNQETESPGQTKEERTQKTAPTPQTTGKAVQIPAINEFDKSKEGQTVIDVLNRLGTTDEQDSAAGKGFEFNSYLDSLSELPEDKTSAQTNFGGLNSELNLDPGRKEELTHLFPVIEERPEQVAVEAKDDLKGIAQFGDTTQVRAGEQLKAKGVYAGIDLRALEPSTEIGVMQNRNRADSAASAAQVSKIESRPDPDRLISNDVFANDGPMVVGVDDLESVLKGDKSVADSNPVIIAGNGRVMGIKSAYQKGNAADYVQALFNRAQEFGLDPRKFQKFDMPGLVRLIDKNQIQNGDYRNFVLESNKSRNMGLLSSEKAVSDGEAILQFLGKLETSADNLNTQANQPFFNEFFNQVVTSIEERAPYFTTDGKRLSQDGLARIKNAIFQAAYQQPELLMQMSDEPDPSIRTILNGLQSAAPDVARLTAQIEREAVHPLSLGQAISEAAQKISDLRKEGLKPESYFEQGTFGTDSLSPEARILLGFFGSQKSQQKINHLMREFNASVRKLGSPNQMTFSGMETATPTTLEILESVIQREFPESAQNLERWKEGPISMGADFSRKKQKDSQSVTIDSINEEIDKIQYSPAVRGVVLHPVETVEQASAMIGQKVHPDAEGFFFPDKNVIVLIAENLHSQDRVKEVLAHEVFGHHILPRYLGGTKSQWSKELMSLSESDATVKKVFDEEVKPYYDERSYASELSARLAETYSIEPEALSEKAKRWIEKTKSDLNSFLRGLGINVEFDLYDVSNVLQGAREVVTNPNKNLHYLFDADVEDIEPTPEFSVATREISPADYPETLAKVESQTNMAKLNKHPDYYAAKKEGDASAAMRVVEDMINDNVLLRIKNKLDRKRPVVFVPVLDFEGQQKNMLPMAYAAYLASRLNGQVLTDVFQKKRKIPGKTQKLRESSPDERTQTETEFIGEIPSSENQIVIVDDVFTSGNTTAAIIDEMSKGGNMPVAATSLAMGRYQNWLTLPDKTAKAVLNKAGMNALQFKNEFGYPVTHLTGSEAQAYILNGGRGLAGAKKRFPVRSVYFDNQIQAKIAAEPNPQKRTIAQKFAEILYSLPVDEKQKSEHNLDRGEFYGKESGDASLSKKKAKDAKNASRIEAEKTQNRQLSEARVPTQKIVTIAETHDWLRHHKYSTLVSNRYETNEVLNQLANDPKFMRLNIFDRGRIVAQVQRPQYTRFYKKVTSPHYNQKSLGWDDAPAGIAPHENNKTKGSGILLVDPIVGCNHMCVSCFGIDGASRNKIGHQYVTERKVRGIIREENLLRIGEVGDPCHNWQHVHEQISALIDRSKKRGQKVDYSSNVVYTTKLLNIKGINPDTVKNLQVSLDPLYPAHMTMTMNNIEILKGLYPDISIALRIRTFVTNNQDLQASQRAAADFANDHDMPVIETLMRFHGETLADILELEMSAYGKEYGSAWYETDADSSQLKNAIETRLLCDKEGKGCPGCMNCVNLVRGKRKEVLNRQNPTFENLEGLKIEDIPWFDPVGGDDIQYSVKKSKTAELLEKLKFEPMPDEQTKQKSRVERLLEQMDPEYSIKHNGLKNTKMRPRDQRTDASGYEVFGETGTYTDESPAIPVFQDEEYELHQSELLDDIAMESALVHDAFSDEEIEREDFTDRARAYARRILQDRERRENARFAAQQRALTGKSPVYSLTKDSEKKTNKPFRLFSQMQETLQKPGMLPNKTTPAKMIQTINNHVGKFKKQELEESGLLEHIQSFGSEVTRKDVLDYLDANKIEIIETRKKQKWQITLTNGEIEVYDTYAEAEKTLQEELDWIEEESAGIVENENEVEVHIFDGSTPVFRAFLNNNGEWEKEVEPWEDEEVYPNKRAAIAEAEEVEESIKEQYYQEVPDVPELSDSKETQYEFHTMPGGDNYQELLLRLPESKLPKEPTTTIEDEKLINDVTEAIDGMFGTDSAGAEEYALEAYKSEGIDGFIEHIMNYYDAMDLIKMYSESEKNYYIREALKEFKNTFEGYENIPGEFTAEEELELDREISKRSIVGKKQISYESPHWKEKNILLHLRTNERTVDGVKTLFVEEIQSDWHQEAREKGYVRNFKVEDVIPGTELYRDFEKWFRENRAETDPTFEEFEKLSAMQKRSYIEAFKDEFSSERSLAVPNAPFKKNWPLLGIKRIIQEAVDQGFDQVMWTSGKMQADRYDLRKYIDEIRYRKGGTVNNEKYIVTLHKYGSGALETLYLKEKELEPYFGEKITKKMLSNEGESVEATTYQSAGKALRGLDLEVGGSGMLTFYDKILPNAIKKYVKKFGGKVEKVVQGEQIVNFMQPDGTVVGNIDEDGLQGAWRIVLSPELREEVKTRGQPMYAIKSTGFKNFDVSPNRRFTKFDPGAVYYEDGSKHSPKIVRATQEFLDTDPELRELHRRRNYRQNERFRRRQERLNPRYAIAHHGTPHTLAPEPGFPHGRFRLNKVGSGEGNQAFGWGIYFAENPEVSETYRENLRYNNKPGIIEVDGKNYHWKDALDKFVDPMEAKFLKKYVSREGAHPDKLERLLLEIVMPEIRVAMNLAPEDYLKVNWPEDDSSHYRLDIPDHVIPKLLDWDKPLSKQTPHVRNALSDYIKQGASSSSTGEWIYKELQKPFMAKSLGYDLNEGAKSVSEYLRSKGIPGVKYLDGFSRYDGAGTSNYVIWDQDVLDSIALLERNSEFLDEIQYSIGKKETALDRKKEKDYNEDREAVVYEQEEVQYLANNLSDYRREIENGIEPGIPELLYSKKEKQKGQKEKPKQLEFQFFDAQPQKKKKKFGPLNPEKIGLKEGFSETSKERFSTQTRLKIVGEVRTGFKKITTAKEAAHLFAPLRKYPAENLAIAVLDKDKNLLGVMNLARGVKDETFAQPDIIVGSAARIPGARYFWIGHNHPSGLPQLSNPDKRVFHRIRELTLDTGIELEGMLAIGDKKAGVISQKELTEFPIKPASRIYVAPEIEKYFTKRFKKGQANNAERVFQEAQAFPEFHKKGQTFLMFANSQNELLGALPVTKRELKKLRTKNPEKGFGRIVAAIDKANATRMFLVTDDLSKAKNYDFIKNLAKFGNDLEVPLLDVVDRKGESLRSEEGYIPSSPIFASIKPDSEQSPDDQDKAKNPFEPQPEAAEPPKTTGAKGVLEEVVSGAFKGAKWTGSLIDAVFGDNSSVADRKLPEFIAAQKRLPEAETLWELEREGRNKTLKRLKQAEDKLIIDHMSADKNQLIATIKKVTAKHPNLRDWLVKKVARVYSAIQSAKPVEQTLFTIAEHMFWDGEKMKPIPGFRELNKQTGKFEYKIDPLHANLAQNYFDSLSPEWKELLTERAKKNEEFRQSFVNTAVPWRTAQITTALAARHKQIGNENAFEKYLKQAKKSLERLPKDWNARQKNRLKSDLELLENISEMQADTMEGIVRSNSEGQLRSLSQLNRDLNKIESNQGIYGYVHHHFEGEFAPPSKGKAFDALGNIPHSWFEEIAGPHKMRSGAPAGLKNLLQADIAQIKKEIKAEAANTWMQKVEDQYGLLVQEMKESPNEMPEGYEGLHKVVANFGKYQGEEIYLPDSVFEHYQMTKARKSTTDPSLKEFNEALGAIEGITNRVNYAMLYHTGKAARDILSQPFHLAEFLFDWSIKHPGEIPAAIKSLAFAIPEAMSARTWQKDTPETFGNYEEALPLRDDQGPNVFVRTMDRLIKGFPIGSVAAKFLTEINLAGAGNLPIMRVMRLVGEDLADHRGLTGKERDRFVWDVTNEYAYYTYDLPRAAAYLRGQRPTQGSKTLGMLSRTSVPFMGYGTRLFKQMLADPALKGFFPMTKRLVGRGSQEKGSLLAEIAETTRPLRWLFLLELLKSGIIPGGLFPPEEEGMATDIQDRQGLDPVARTAGRLLVKQDEDPEGGEYWLTSKGMGPLQAAHALDGVTTGQTKFTDFSTEFLSLHPNLQLLLGTLGIDSPYTRNVPINARWGRFAATVLAPELIRLGPDIAKFIRMVTDNNTLPDNRKQNFLTAFFEQLGAPIGPVRIDRQTGELILTTPEVEKLKWVGLNMRYIPYRLIASEVEGETRSLDYLVRRYKTIQKYRAGTINSEMPEKEFVLSRLHDYEAEDLDEAEQNLLKEIQKRGGGAYQTVLKLQDKGVSVFDPGEKKEKAKKKKASKKTSSFGSGFGSSFDGGFGSGLRKKLGGQKKTKAADLILELKDNDKNKEVKDVVRWLEEL